MRASIAACTRLQGFRVAYSRLPLHPSVAVLTGSINHGDGIAERYTSVRELILKACQRSGRSASDVTLVAVSKGHPPDAVLAAFQFGQRIFGESYAQELAMKVEQVSQAVVGSGSGHSALSWHFIGGLQRNKVRAIAPHVDVVQAVDSPRLVAAMDREFSKRSRSLRVMVQVNLAEEAQKNGCLEGDLPRLLRAIGSAEGLDVIGLMGIPPRVEDAEASRSFFRRLKQLADAHDLKEVSMGMSHDFAIAIEEGATMVRVGEALFGPRPPKPHNSQSGQRAAPTASRRCTS